MQQLADGLTADKIDALRRKWLARLPHPFSANDRKQGIRYDISMLQAEFARTEVFDRPVAGRVFFEEVMRENLDMGRPDHVQLIFNRRVSRRTPTRHRTRVITDGVIPSLHVDYKHSRIKQYHKEGRALRTETVINDTYDFDVGRRLKNLDDLKQIGFAANRRLLGVERGLLRGPAGTAESASGSVFSDAVHRLFRGSDAPICQECEGEHYGEVCSRGTEGPRFARIAFTTHGQPRPSTRCAGPPLRSGPSGDCRG